MQVTCVFQSCIGDALSHSRVPTNFAFLPSADQILTHTSEMYKNVYRPHSYVPIHCLPRFSAGGPIGVAEDPASRSLLHTTMV